MAWAQRIDRSLGHPLAVVLLGVFFSLWAVFSGVPHHSLPLRNLPASPASDIRSHAEFVASAAEAMAEGQLPPREVLRVDDPSFRRYPLFQFYSLLPYEVPAALVLLGVNPYRALVWAVFLAFLLGFTGFFVLARTLGAGNEGAVLGSVAFTVAPYHLTDLFGRSAYPELFCFGLVPWLFWAMWTLARKPGTGPFLLSSLLWSCLILSHNIFHVWSVLVVFLSLAYSKWIGGVRELHLNVSGASYLFGLASSLFFFAVPLILGPKTIVSAFPVPSGLTPLSVLLDPLWSQVAIAGESPQLGLQVGWPLLAGFVWFALVHRGRAWRNGFWLFFLVLMLMIWSPLEYRAWLGPYQIIQFPYRLLLYATLYGGVLLSLCYEQVEQARRARILPFLVLALCAWSLPWKRVEATTVTAEQCLERWRRKGTLFRTRMLYLMEPSRLDGEYRRYDLSFPARSEARRFEGPLGIAALARREDSIEMGEASSAAAVRVRAKAMEDGTIVVFPIAWYPDIYEVKVNGRQGKYGFLGQNLAVRVDHGESVIECRLKGYGWANGLSIVSWIAWALLALSWVVNGLYKRRGSATLGSAG